ncbi:MAG: SDR family oxidoreductase [Desulfurococcales archaeon]|nr:SDR family oxidoreductase [Desulfurococcales archaeon]
MGYNPRVLVTAASQGIGRHIAMYLHKQGYRVIGTSRMPEKHDSPYELEYLDFRKKDSIEKLVAKVNYTRAAVINTGNPSCEPCKFLDTNYEDWMEGAQLFLAGPLYLTKLLIQEAIKRDGKISITLISAASVLEPMPYFTVSDTVRSGLSRVAKVVSRTFPSNVRINVLLLGSYDTPGARYNVRKIGEKKGLAGEDSAWKKLVLERNPNGKIGEPYDLGRTVEFLLFEASYINGTTILIDGSMTKAVLI